jgi:hypothetical protein
MRAYWDFSAAPITFDCITFFALAYQLMQKVKDEHWDLTVFDRGVFRRQSDKDIILNNEEKERRVEHIFKPLLRCLRGLRSYQIFRDTKPALGIKFSPPYLAVDVVKLFYEGFDPRVIEVPKFAQSISEECIKDDVPFVTFTCRSSRYQPLRNTNVDAFNSVASQLSRKGVKCVLITDVEGGSDFVPDPSLWFLCDAARHNMHLRLGLYARALCNVSTGGGAAHSLWYSHLPFISTIPHIENYSQGNSSSWMAVHGTPYGVGYPWFAENQTFLFGEEKSEKIMEALHKGGI